jgi:hypothetical protein
MTNHSTSTDRFREFIQGLRDGGTTCPRTPGRCRFRRTSRPATPRR